MPTAVLNGRAHDGGVADGPGAPPRRRVFTAEYKLAILAEYDAAEADGSKGSILRREGLHSSRIVEWRRARDAGALAAMQAASPGRAKRPAADGRRRTGAAAAPQRKVGGRVGQDEICA